MSQLPTSDDEELEERSSRLHVLIEANSVLKGSITFSDRAPHGCVRMRTIKRKPGSHQNGMTVPASFRYPHFPTAYRELPPPAGYARANYPAFACRPAA